MKITSINSYNNFFKISSFKRSVRKNIINNNLQGDVVSFSAKKYDSESILHPTGHCGYCGCKVYDEKQLEDIAQQMLTNKSGRLQGKIRSVLEKLEGAKHSEEIAISKRLENEEEIRFFERFLKFSSDNSYMKGNEIIEKLFSTSGDEAIALLKQNLNPLLKTIDHISPQNLGQDNNNSDINLVEACYCCNHDIKNGLPFSEFYNIYPSIQENMPEDKFEYAMSSLLESSGDTLKQRLTAAHLLDAVKRMFIQRDEAIKHLDYINFRIQSYSSQYEAAIQECRDEINEKLLQIKQKQERLSELSTDEEFMALQRKIVLDDKIKQEETLIDSLSRRIKTISNQINDIRDNHLLNTSSKNKKDNQQLQYTQLSSEEKQSKIAELKNDLEQIQIQIEQHINNKQQYEKERQYLEEKYPPVSILQHRKNFAESILQAYNESESIDIELNDKYLSLSRLQSELEGSSGSKQTAIKKYIERTKKEISLLSSRKKQCSHRTSEMSKMQAVRTIEELSAKIPDSIEKERYMEYPQIIKRIQAEIKLLEDTITELEQQQLEIINA